MIFDSWFMMIFDKTKWDPSNIYNPKLPSFGGTQPTHSAGFCCHPRCQSIKGQTSGWKFHNSSRLIWLTYLFQIWSTKWGIYTGFTMIDVHDGPSRVTKNNWCLKCLVVSTMLIALTRPWRLKDWDWKSWLDWAVQSSPARLWKISIDIVGVTHPIYSHRHRKRNGPQTRVGDHNQKCPTACGCCSKIEIQMGVLECSYKAWFKSLKKNIIESPDTR